MNASSHSFRIDMNLGDVCHATYDMLQTLPMPKIAAQNLRFEFNGPRLTVTNLMGKRGLVVHGPIIF